MKSYGVTGLLCFNSKRCDYELSGLVSFDTICLSFNSKRCDYERFRTPQIADVAHVSIPKGAIMSLLLLYYNMLLRVSIPKGAIMSIAACCKGGCLGCFNSKRCDYEKYYFSAHTSYINVSIPKGAIMSSISINDQFVNVKFQFQKVRL